MCSSSLFSPMKKKEMRSAGRWLNDYRICAVSIFCNSIFYTVFLLDFVRSPLSVRTGRRRQAAFRPISGRAHHWFMMQHSPTHPRPFHPSIHPPLCPHTEFPTNSPIRPRTRHCPTRFPTHLPSDKPPLPPRTHPAPTHLSTQVGTGLHTHQTNLLPLPNTKFPWRISWVSVSPADTPAASFCQGYVAFFASRTFIAIISHPLINWKISLSTSAPNPILNASKIFLGLM